MSSPPPTPTGDYGKSTAGMRRHTTSLEPDSMDLGIESTPVDRFFVCSGSDAPSLATSDFALTIGGDAADGEVTLDWSALQALPQRSLDAWLECAGNGRRMYGLAGGHTISAEMIDTPWTLGGMGMAQWTGVSLRDVLTLAGVGSQASWVGVWGADHDNVEEEPAGMCLPLDKALDPDTIIATTMNGAPLLAAHGHPARLVVPGWVGAYSVKWIERIEIASEWLPTWRGDVYYRLRAPDGTDLGPATAHPIKSCLALDWPATLAPGDQIVQGYARCGEREVDRVEVSVDGGEWQPARLLTRLGTWGWQPFAFDWQATVGDHKIRTRAFDVAGNTQPDHKDFHPNTILWNAITEHPVTVQA